MHERGPSEDDPIGKAIEEVYASYTPEAMRQAVIDAWPDVAKKREVDLTQDPYVVVSELSLTGEIDVQNVLDALDAARDEANSQALRTRMQEIIEETDRLKQERRNKVIKNVPHWLKRLFHRPNES
jgi:hypothetical protein